MTWQTPVSQSLRDLRFKRADYGAQINLQHLLSQTSGLMPHAYTNLVEDRMSYAQIIKRLDQDRAKIEEETQSIRGEIKAMEKRITDIL